MPTHLEIPQAIPNMVISPPSINLRKAAAYHEKGPLSATSSVFSFNHLVFNSPPPSPGLPHLVPRRPRRLSGAPRPTRVLRIVFWMSVVLVMFYITSFALRKNRNVSFANWYLQKPDTEYEMVVQEGFPDFATPVAVEDKHGNAKWSFYVPADYVFPLDVQEYSDVAAKCHEVADHVRDVMKQKTGSQHSFFHPKNFDPNFVDVSEALAQGMLPKANTGLHNLQGQVRGLVGVKEEDIVDKPVCKKTMTYVLESDDAGLGSAAMLLWITYGVAQKQGRAFFIDDSRWAYGRYMDIFQSPPVPTNCRPPPRHEMIPCPHQARHLVVTATTARETLEMAFSKEFEDPMQMEMYRQRQMFALARKGYEALFKLNDEDAKYVEKRIAEFNQKTSAGKTGSHEGAIVGVHVRHGDCHPLEYQYHESYIPLDHYHDKVVEILEHKFNKTGARGSEDKEAKSHSYVVLASDDPTVYEAEEFKGALRAQSYINLASKSAIHQAKYPQGGKSKPHAWIDDEFGWEGGFFAPMFWNLGVKSRPSQDTQVTVQPPAETTRLRGLMGRAYMMDLAVMSSRSDAIVCTVSSTGCRLLAVMMGWESSIEKGNWVNIDGGYGWTGLTW